MMQVKAELLVAVHEVQLSHALRANTADYKRSAGLLGPLVVAWPPYQAALSTIVPWK
jgi:hypothetical protein